MKYTNGANVLHKTSHLLFVISPFTWSRSILARSFFRAGSLDPVHGTFVCMTCVYGHAFIILQVWQIYTINYVMFTFLLIKIHLGTKLSQSWLLGSSWHWMVCMYVYMVIMQVYHKSIHVLFVTLPFFWSRSTLARRFLRVNFLDPAPGASVCTYMYITWSHVIVHILHNSKYNSVLRWSITFVADPVGKGHRGHVSHLPSHFLHHWGEYSLWFLSDFISVRILATYHLLISWSTMCTISHACTNHANVRNL